MLFRELYVQKANEVWKEQGIFRLNPLKISLSIKNDVMRNMDYTMLNNIVNNVRLLVKGKICINTVSFFFLFTQW